MSTAVADETEVETSVYLVVFYETYLGPTYIDRVQTEDGVEEVLTIRSNAPAGIDSYFSEAEARREFGKITQGTHAYLLHVVAAGDDPTGTAIDLVRECAAEVEESEEYGSKLWGHLFLDDEEGRAWYDDLVLEDTHSRLAV